MRSTSRICVGVNPKPETAMTCGLLGALSVMVTVAVRLPAAVGVNVTPTVHVLFGFNVLGETGQLFEMAKSPALIATLEMVSGTSPLLARVMFWLALVVAIT